jgi:hypothetical protein
MPARGRYGSVNREHPEAAGVCDRGGEVRKLSELRKEMIWAGKTLRWNGMLCCAEHIDPPHDQDRVLILKPDPVPVQNPRPLLPMVPKHGYLDDGIPSMGQTASYVTTSILSGLRGPAVNTLRFAQPPVLKGKFIE